MRTAAVLVAAAFSMLTPFVEANAVPKWDPQPVEIQEFNEEEAVWLNGYGLDLSEASKGLVMGSCTSDVNLKLGINHDGKDTWYSVPGDGTPFTVPLMENGSYTVSVMEQVEGTKYRYGLTIPLEVLLDDPVSPCLYPNIYVPYTLDSEVVREAGKLRDSSWYLEQFMKQVDGFARANVTYDEDLVVGALSEHEINPDKTLSSGKGICLDFASLVTAMFRSQGVPAKLVFGYVTVADREPAYHAWTEVWDGQSWTIIDACMPESAEPYAIYEMTQEF